ncbi:hypothetical protein IH992_25700, partial [Candidatus Poribacteria bacterium]|nr:hypothetical protein [Candidatus Poribacteria bacterium]
LGICNRCGNLDKKFLRSSGFDFWRFHRGTNRLKNISEFIFEFCSSEETARTIFEHLKFDSSLRELENVGLVKLECNPNKFKPNFEDIAQPEDLKKPNDKQGWPPELRKSWPYFITGLSEMWLALIREIADSFEEKPTSLSELQTFYQQIDEKMTQVWKEKGCHSLIHHLSAMFAYKDVDVVGRFKELRCNETSGQFKGTLQL